MDRHSDLAARVADLDGSEVVASTAIGGGDFAASFRVELADGRTVFAKTHADPPANFFSTEAAGLSWLRAADALAVPEVLGVSDEPPLLVLAWIDESHRTTGNEADFGRGLAALHRAGAACFGREDRRSTGSRGLPNEPCTTWAEFYASQRLLPLTRLARDAGIYRAADVQVFEQVASRLAVLCPDEEAPARLHGDLWAGNRIVDAGGTSWLIDPACHGGHREFDLAMMRLFGGFGDAAFKAYDESFPLAPDWQDRIALHQLAPLLVHAIKFRGSYISAALAAAKSTT